MNDGTQNIIDFIRHPGLLNDQSHSETQIAILKSVYGLPLTETELEIYRQATGRENYDAEEHMEVTAMSGRQGGKTEKVSGPIVCYEAFRDHGLKPGEVGFVMLLAPTIAQARIAFTYIRNYLRNSLILSKRIVKTTKRDKKPSPVLGSRLVPRLC
jgi:hypothetical protein